MMFGKDCPDASEGAARGYAEAVLSAALKIRLLNYIKDVQSAVLSSGVEGDALVAMATEGLYTATNRRARKPYDARSVSIRYDKAMDELMNASARPILKTGLSDLDACIDELLPGEYTIVGNDTGGGKTTFAVTVAYNAAKAGRHVVYVSGEMTEKEIYDGFVSAESGIPRGVLRTGRLTNEQLSAYVSGLERASALPLTIIDDISELTPLKVFNRLLPIAQHQPIHLIIWDQLWLTKLDIAHNQQRPARPMELREVVNRIKRDIAQHPLINAHVLLLQQYKGDRDKDTLPRMSDFAESSDPARFADFVFLMERTNKGANLYIGKNRSSGRYVGRRVELVFDYERSIYRDAPALPFSPANAKNAKGGAR
jgi:replicative DNA helicase